jgi:hypothetical protein
LFCQKRRFQTTTVLNQATYYQLEHRFGKVVFTAFQISAIFDVAPLLLALWALKA